MNKKTLGVIIIIVIIIGGGIVIATSGGAVVPTIDVIQTPVINGTTTDTTTSTQKTYTLAEVAKHPDATSCWTAVNGNVYDLTPFVSKHPGGERNILRICGKDGTTTFTDQHGGQRRPENELANLLIGTLAK